MSRGLLLIHSLPLGKEAGLIPPNPITASSLVGTSKPLGFSESSEAKWECLLQDIGLPVIKHVQSLVRE